MSFWDPLALSVACAALALSAFCAARIPATRAAALFRIKAPRTQ